MMKKLTACFFAILMILTLTMPAFAAGGVQLFAGVTQQMTNASYWAAKQPDAGTVLMTPKQIAAYNKTVAAAPNTYRVDLYSEPRTYDATQLKSVLLSDLAASKPDEDLYDGETKLDADALFENMASALRVSAWTGSMQFRYAICTTHTAIYQIPCDTVIGFSSTDADSEFQLSELRVNEPFLVKQICEFGGKTYYWGLSSHLSGWVNAAHLALCSGRDSWKNAFEVDPAGKDFIVVTADKIITEPSIKVPETSNVKLTIGTVLKLIPEDKMPEAFGERWPYNNYAVYLPTRKADGTYQKVPALIQQHSDVSVGYLPMTQANLLKVAFNCLGNRYGWAGMLDSMDCSLYTRAVYLCCGLNMPRNTTWQQNVPDTLFSLKDKTDAQKLTFLAKLPAGTLLYFPGHTMIFLGMENGMGYVISDTGSLSAPTGALNVKSVYSVIINPLSARRRDGSTWLQNLISAVVPFELNSHRLQSTFVKASPTQTGKQQSICMICGHKMKDVVIASPKQVKLSRSSCRYTGKPITPKLTVVDTNAKTIDPSFYTVKYSKNTNIGTATVTVKFTGKYAGSLQKTFNIVPKGTKIKSVQAVNGKLIVSWKAQQNYTDGYQIQYASNQSFSKNDKIIKIKDTSVDYRTIKKLESGTYYVRIRTYKLVDGSIMPSAWSESTRIKLAA